jgi:muconolactone D-isomerase
VSQQAKLRGCCEITVALLRLLAVLRVLSASPRLATLISQQPLKELLSKTQRILQKKPQGKNKLYALHVLEKWPHLWRVVGEYTNYSVFDVGSNDELHDTLSCLPLFPFMKIAVTLLARHPSSLRQPELLKRPGRHGWHRACCATERLLAELAASC